MGGQYKGVPILQDLKQEMDPKRAQGSFYLAKPEDTLGQKLTLLAYREGHSHKYLGVLFLGMPISQSLRILTGIKGHLSANNICLSSLGIPISRSQCIITSIKEDFRCFQLPRETTLIQFAEVGSWKACWKAALASASPPNWLKSGGSPLLSGPT